MGWWSQSRTGRGAGQGALGRGPMLLSTAGLLGTLFSHKQVSRSYCERVVKLCMVQFSVTFRVDQEGTLAVLLLLLLQSTDVAH